MSYNEGAGGAWNIQQHFALSAMFFLGQAQADEIATVEEPEAAIGILRLARQMYVYHRYRSNLSAEETREQGRMLFDNACDIAKSVPAFFLRASLTGRFWEAMEKALTGAG